MQKCLHCHISIFIQPLAVIVGVAFVLFVIQTVEVEGGVNWAISDRALLKWMSGYSRHRRHFRDKGNSPCQSWFPGVPLPVLSPCSVQL